MPGVRDVKVSLQLDYPEVHVDTDREMAGLVGTSEREAAETTLQATLGNINTPGVWIDSNNGQSYYVVTSYDGAKVTDTESLGALPVRISPDGPAGAPPAPMATCAARSARWPSSATTSSASRTCSCRPRGATSAPPPRSSRRRCTRDPRTSHVDSRFVGQVALMRTPSEGSGSRWGSP